MEIKQILGNPGKFICPQLEVDMYGRITKINNGSFIEVINGISTRKQHLEIKNKGDRLQIYSKGDTHSFMVPDASHKVNGFMTTKHIQQLESKIDNILPEGGIIIGNESGRASLTRMKGDATLSANGVLTLVNQNNVKAGTYQFPVLEVNKKGLIVGICKQKDFIMSLNGLISKEQSLELVHDPTKMGWSTKNQNTHTLSLPWSDRETDGLLRKEDFNIFNDKIPNSLELGHILVGDTKNKPRQIKIRGDVAMTNSGEFRLEKVCGTPGYYNFPSIQVDESGRVVRVCENRSSRIFTINGLCSQDQKLVSGSQGNDFSIVSDNDCHTFNIPYSGYDSSGLLRWEDFQRFDQKIDSRGIKQIIIKDSSDYPNGLIFQDDEDGIRQTRLAMVDDDLIVCRGETFYMFGEGRLCLQEKYESVSITIDGNIQSDHITVSCNGCVVEFGEKGVVPLLDNINLGSRSNYFNDIFINGSLVIKEEKAVKMTDMQMKNLSGSLDFGITDSNTVRFIGKTSLDDYLSKMMIYIAKLDYQIRELRDYCDDLNSKIKINIRK